MGSKARQFATIPVTDPDTGELVDVALLKIETGAIVGIDASFLEQEVGPIMSPYDEDDELDLGDEDD